MYFVAGLSICAFIFLILREFRFRPWAAGSIAILFSISPSAICYENWLFYTYPVAALVTAAAYFAVKMAKTGKLVFSGWFLGFSAVLVLTRTLFHPTFFLMAVALALFYTPRSRKKVFVQGLLFLLPILAVLLKNLIVFGFFGTSSWYGLNLAKPTTFMLSDRERESLVAEGILSEHALIHPFGELWRRTEWLSSAELPVFGTAATDSMEKTTGETNYNHVAYIELSREYFRDALVVLRTRPSTFARALFHAYGHYFVPASCYPLVEDNVSKLGLYGRAYELVLQGSPIMLSKLELALAEDSGDLPVVILSMNLFMLVLLPFACLYWWIGLFRRKLPQYMIPLMLVFIFVTIVGNAVEVGENNRFRFMIDPLIVVIIVTAISIASKKASSLLLENKAL